MKEINSEKQFSFKPYKDGIIITKCLMPEEDTVIPTEKR